jgi:chromatin remodeling complex protein RSC6
MQSLNRTTNRNLLSNSYIIAILEVSRTRSLFDFAIAISSIDQLYSYIIEFDINYGIKKDDIPQLTNLVEDFRNY